MTYGFWSRLLILTMIFIALQSRCVAEEPISWGLSNASLRLGLAVETNGDLRVVINNLNPTSASVFVAINGGNLLSYLFQFTATLDKTHSKIWDLRPGSNAGVAGLLVPELIDVAPGTSREFLFPLKHLVYMDKGRDIPMDRLLQQGYTLDVSLEVQPKNLDGASMGGIPQPVIDRLWTGLVVSSFRYGKPGHRS